MQLEVRRQAVSACMSANTTQVVHHAMQAMCRPPVTGQDADKRRANLASARAAWTVVRQHPAQRSLWTVQKGADATSALGGGNRELWLGDTFDEFFF
jgi:hypothetical protein